MDRKKVCRIERLLPNGRLVVRIDERKETVKIFGIDVPDPPAELYVEIMTKRIPKRGMPLRCVAREFNSTGQKQAQIFCFGWHDKSGDVWLDLAILLLKEGLARVAAGKSPQRERYLDCEEEARSLGMGIWSGR